MRILLKKLREFSKKEDGVIAITFAMALIPITMAVGGAVDYSRHYMNSSRLQDAIDAATMATAVEFVKSGKAKESIDIGKTVFAANCPAEQCDPAIEPNIVVNKSKSVTGSYDTKLDTVFLRIARIDNMESHVESEVAFVSRYQEFHFALDYSDSFNIASTADDIYLLKSLTKPYEIVAEEPDGCAFACHEIEGPEPEPIYDIANANQIPLREDVMYEAAARAADVILERITGTHADQIRVGAFAFSDGVELLSKPTADSQNIKVHMRQGNIRHWGTRYDLVLPHIAEAIGKSGDGSSRKDPMKTVILLTDGVWTNYWNDKDNMTWHKPIDPVMCDAFKNNGVRVVVINIAYPTGHGGALVDQFVRPFAGELDTALQACATPGYYYTANEKPEIQAELLKMARAVSQPVLAFTR